MAQLTTPKSVLLSGDRLSVVGFESHYYSNSSSTSANSNNSSGALRFIHNKHKPNFSSNRGGFTFTVHATMSSNNNNYINDMNSERSSTTSSPGNSNRIFDEILEDDDELSEFYIDNNELSSFRGLVLDISYRPVNVVCWKRAICLEFTDKADVLEYYDQTVNSCSGSFYIPAVLRVPHLLQVVKRRKVKRGLSRKNILSRDNFTCQYCSSIENLTIDHVLPIARGGKWTWENLVTACAKCNSKKGHKTLEEVNMELMKIPKAPKDYDLLAIPLTNHAIKLLRNRKEMPEEWQQYLSKPFLAP